MLKKLASLQPYAVCYDVLSLSCDLVTYVTDGVNLNSTINHCIFIKNKYKKWFWAMAKGKPI